MAEWSERKIANVEVATVLGSFPASSDTAESKERQMKLAVLNKVLKKRNPPLLIFFIQKEFKMMTQEV
jgi:hypothetical protein